MIRPFTEEQQRVWDRTALGACEEMIRGLTRFRQVATFTMEEILNFLRAWGSA